MLEQLTILIAMNKLSGAKQAAILKALTEGASIRATARMVGVSKTTVLKLLVEVGELCAIYQDHMLRKLPCRKIEADEIWCFLGAKARNAKTPGFGDIWTFTAICADTKLMVSWRVGQRDAENFEGFMRDLASRLANRVQLTTDGHSMYRPAVEKAFGYNGVDFSQLVKTYAFDHGPGGRYSPPVCTGTIKTRIMGHPDEASVSTSFVERQNLNLRMQSRRFTRLTNAFSKKVENHAHAVALHFMVYNFCRAHGTLTKAANGVHTSPAMAAGLADHVWKVEDLVALLDPATVLPLIGAHNGQSTGISHD
jgi:IS1 family transposase